MVELDADISSRMLRQGPGATLLKEKVMVVFWTYGQSMEMVLLR